MIRIGPSCRVGYKKLYPLRRRRKEGPIFFTLHPRSCGRIGLGCSPVIF